MNVRLFKRILWQALLVPVLLLLAVAGALIWQIENMVKAQHWVDHSDRVTAHLQELEKLIIDQETGLRGYQLTSNRVMLAPYEAAAPLIPGRFNELRSLLAKDADQSNRLAQIYDRYEIWLAFAQTVLGMKSDAMRDGALNLQGKQLMDEVRARTGEMLEVEGEVRRQRSESVQQQVKLVLAVVLVTALISGLLIALFLYSRLRIVSRAYQRSLDEAHVHAAEAFESRQWFATTLDSIGDGVIACDAEGRVELMNRVAREMTGWSTEDAHGRPLEQVFKIINEESRFEAENPAEKVRRLNTVVGLTNHTLLIRKNGEELLLDDSAAPIRDERGRITGIVLVFRDVTEKRRVESAAVASEKLAVAGALAANIAHEIHNPLDSVANLHFLLWSERDQDKRDEYLKMAQQELTRALQISRAMLSLYRQPEQAVAIELKELIESVLLLLRRNFEHAAVKIETRLAEVCVKGFPAELRQVFTNLILNAIDAAGEGGAVLIVLRAADNEGLAGALVEIADTGAGIDEKIRRSLFQPFFTTKAQAGTGLGLWVSLGMIQKHGGTIDLLSSSQSGYPGAMARVFVPSAGAIE